MGVERMYEKVLSMLVDCRIIRSECDPAWLEIMVVNEELALLTEASKGIERCTLVLEGSSIIDSLCFRR